MNQPEASPGNNADACRGLSEGVGANVPTEDGFYWATSIRRQGRKTRLGDYGQAGGLRWIVRVFRYDDDEVFRVQIFGSERLRDVRDYKDWEGPIGRLHWPGKSV